jgi:hypothetical protein
MHTRCGAAAPVPMPPAGGLTEIRPREGLRLRPVPALLLHAADTVGATLPPAAAAAGAAEDARGPA